MKNSNVVSYEDVIDQIIWNNKNIAVDKQSLFEKHLFCQGIVKIGDLLSNTGKFLQSSKVLRANLSPTQYFKLIGVVDAIPIAWRLIIKQSQRSQHFHSSFLGDKTYIELDETEIDLSKVTSKLLYNKFKTKKQTPPSAQSKMKNKYPQLVVEWEKIYSLPFTVTVETKLREFKYKILNDIVYTNDKLFRFKMIESPLCTFLSGRRLIPRAFTLSLYYNKKLLAFILILD